MNRGAAGLVELTRNDTPQMRVQIIVWATNCELSAYKQS